MIGGRRFNHDFEELLLCLNQGMHSAFHLGWYLRLPRQLFLGFWFAATLFAGSTPQSVRDLFPCVRFTHIGPNARFQIFQQKPGETEIEAEDVSEILQYKYCD